MKHLGSFIYGIVGVATAMVGYTMHSSLFWSIMDFIFTPITWAKWLVCHEVNISIIKKSFEFFFN